MGNPNIRLTSPSGYDAEPIIFPADPPASIKEDDFVLGLFRHPQEDALEPLYAPVSVDIRKEL